MVIRNPPASELSKVGMLGTQSSEKSRLGRTYKCIYIPPLLLPHGFSAITTMWIFKLQAQVVRARGSFRRSHQDVTKFVSEVSGFLDALGNSFDRFLARFGVSANSIHFFPRKNYPSLGCGPDSDGNLSVSLDLGPVLPSIDCKRPAESYI